MTEALLFLLGISSFVFLGVFGQNLDPKEVDYYVKLVETETKKALSYNLSVDASEYKTTSSETRNVGDVDFVVIGAGAGGCVVANRLSEVKDWSVLVLEAGGFENNFTDIPGMYFFVESSKYNWNFKSTPQKSACLGMVKDQCLYARGKGFGGTTLINGLVYARGYKTDYENWVAEGNPGWSYNDVLKYFIKSENTSIDNADPGYHGTRGYLHVEYHKPFSQQFYSFIEANKELGRKELDYNGKEQLGVSRAQALMVNGRRESSSKAFLNPVLNRPNLKLSGDSYVTSIVISPETRKAVAVNFIKDGKKHTVGVKKDVILAAGTIMSPRILMSSGVGPRKQLNKLKINTIVDLPVGENLHDHPTYYGLNILSNHIEPIKSTRQYVEEYLRGMGPYAVPGNNQGVGFFQTKLAENPGQPDLEMMLIPSNRTNEYFQQSFGYTDDTYRALTKNIQNNSTFTMYIVCLHEKSRGRVTLKSNNPYDYPVIDSGFLTDKGNHDIEVLYQGILMVKEMLNTKAFKKINATMDMIDHPDCRKFKKDSKDYWYCLIRRMTMNLYHPMGTLKMAAKEKNGVADSRLRVHGIQNLRVGDASAIPTTISGHPVAPTTMLAEKLSDMIKEDYNGCEE